MKNFTNIKAVSANLLVLTPSQMLNVKGGIDFITSITSIITDTTTSILTDDKRRDRPGGGISTL